MTSSSPKLVIHHLNHSQSDRIVWLCEELDIPYELKFYKRAPLLAPPELKELSDAGTAPVLEDGDLKLGESGAIAQYLVHKYGNDRLIIKPDEPGWTTYLYWYYFAIASFSPRSSTALMAHLDKSTPHDAGPKQMTRGRYQHALKQVEKRLGSSKFLGADELTLADIMIFFNLTSGRDFLPFSLKSYPNIAEYVKRISGRDAFKKAWAKAEPDWKGNFDVEPEKPALF